MAKAKQTAKSKGKDDKQGESQGRGLRGGVAQKVQPDDQLAAIVGKEPLTRAELTKKVWDYIKSNGLQDAKDRRAINADAKLRPIFGKDQVSMFEMTRLVNQHVR